MEQTTFSFKNHTPKIDPDAYIAPGAKLIGDIDIAKNASIWFNAVLRADLAPIIIGEGSNIQDNSVIHVDHNGPCIVGKNTIVGHNVTLHGCTIGDGCLIGMGAVILSRTKIGDGAIIAAGSLLQEGTHVEPYTLYAGTPAIFKKKLGPAIKKRLTQGAQTYHNLIKEYKKEQYTNK